MNTEVSEINNSTSEMEIATDYNNEETSGINNSESQYSMLYEDDVNNPFFKCNIEKLEYETDEEINEDLSYIRLIIIWNYQINYDWFTIKNSNIFFTKNNLFFENLNCLKDVRNNISTQNEMSVTGKIFKLENNFKKVFSCYIYLIIFYDNAKVNIELYGIFNQLIDEEKLISNIKSENIYGTNGEIDNISNNLNNRDFIVKYIMY